MNRLTSWPKRLAAGLLALLLAVTPATQALESEPQSQEQASAAAAEPGTGMAELQAGEKRKQILKEATNAITETHNALRALDEEDSDAALLALERAAGKLEIILARDPGLALAPAAVDTVTYDVIADVSEVERVRKAAEDALEDGRVQEARILIRDLASETVVRVSNIPLATYPDAIGLAARYVDEGRQDRAKRVLLSALNTLVVTETVIPLPVVAAGEILEEAEALAQNAERSEEENERLAMLIDAARTEVEFAEALGYGSEKEFRDLNEQLDQVAASTEGGRSGTGLFSRVRTFLDDVFASSQPDAPDADQRS